MTDRDIPDRVWSGWVPNDGPRCIIRPLRDDERQALAARAAELRPALQAYARPAEDDRVAQALSDMFSGFPSMRQVGEDVLGRVDCAMRVLAQFPAWAIEEGCLAIQSNGYERVENGFARTERHWPPSDAEICQIVKGVVKLYASALATAEALLSAPVEEPEPPRMTREEIEAKLGRPLPVPVTKAMPPDPPARTDGKHAQRVMADIEARKRRNEAAA